MAKNKDDKRTFQDWLQEQLETSVNDVAYPNVEPTVTGQVLPKPQVFPLTGTPKLPEIPDNRIDEPTTPIATETKIPDVLQTKEVSKPTNGNIIDQLASGVTPTGGANIFGVISKLLSSDEPVEEKSPVNLTPRRSQWNYENLVKPQIKPLIPFDMMSGGTIENKGRDALLKGIQEEMQKPSTLFGQQLPYSTGEAINQRLVREKQREENKPYLPQMWIKGYSDKFPFVKIGTEEGKVVKHIAETFGHSSQKINDAIDGGLDSTPIERAADLGLGLVSSGLNAVMLPMHIVTPASQEIGKQVTDATGSEKVGGFVSNVLPFTVMPNPITFYAASVGSEVATDQIMDVIQDTSISEKNKERILEATGLTTFILTHRIINKAGKLVKNRQQIKEILEDNIPINFTQIRRDITSPVEGFKETKNLTASELGELGRLRQQESRIKSRLKQSGKKYTPDQIRQALVEEGIEPTVENVRRRIKENAEKRKAEELAQFRITPSETVPLHQVTQEALPTTLAEGKKTVIKDPQSRAIVNSLIKKTRTLIREGKKIDEKQITSQIDNVRDAGEKTRLENLYKEVLHHNKKLTRKEEVKNASTIRSDKEINVGEGKIPEGSENISSENIQQQAPRKSRSQKLRQKENVPQTESELSKQEQDVQKLADIKKKVEDADLIYEGEQFGRPLISTKDKKVTKIVTEDIDTAISNVKKEHEEILNKQKAPERKSYKTITDEDGTTWEAVSTSKSGKTNFDIYKNGEKQDLGARKPSDIEEVVNQLRDRDKSAEDFEGVLNWEKKGKGKIEETNDFKDYVVQVSRKFDSLNKVSGANLSIYTRNADGTLSLVKNLPDYKTIAEAKRDATNQIKNIAQPKQEIKPETKVEKEVTEDIKPDTGKTLTKKQQDSVDRINNAINTIINFSEKNATRESQARRKAIDKSFETLRVHSGRLKIPVGERGTYYNPARDIELANSLREKVNEQYGKGKPDVSDINVVNIEKPVDKRKQDVIDKFIPQYEAQIAKEKKSLEITEKEVGRGTNSYKNIKDAIATLESELAQLKRGEFPERTLEHNPELRTEFGIEKPVEKVEQKKIEEATEKVDKEEVQDKAEIIIEESVDAVKGELEILGKDELKPNLKRQKELVLDRLDKQIAKTEVVMKSDEWKANEKKIKKLQDEFDKATTIQEKSKITDKIKAVNAKFDDARIKFRIPNDGDVTLPAYNLEFLKDLRKKVNSQYPTEASLKFEPGKIDTREPSATSPEKTYRGEVQEIKVGKEDWFIVDKQIMIKGKPPKGFKKTAEENQVKPEMVEKYMEKTEGTSDLELKGYSINDIDMGYEAASKNKLPEVKTSGHSGKPFAIFKKGDNEYVVVMQEKLNLAEKYFGEGLEFSADKKGGQVIVKKDGETVAYMTGTKSPSADSGIWTKKDIAENHPAMSSIDKDIANYKPEIEKKVEVKEQPKIKEEIQPERTLKVENTIEAINGTIEKGIPMRGGDYYNGLLRELSIPELKALREHKWSSDRANYEIRDKIDIIIGEKQRLAQEKPKPSSSKSGGVQGSVVGNAAGVKNLASTINVNPNLKHSDLQNVQGLSKITSNLVSDLDYSMGKEVRPLKSILRRFTKKFAGFYSPKSGLVRTQDAKDLSLMAHELGHKIDAEVFQFTEKLGFKKGDKLETRITMISGFKDAAKRQKLLDGLRNKHGASLVDSILERIELRKELKDFANAVGHYKDTTIEAVAEYISKYVIDNANAKKLAPKFTALFEKMMTVEPLIKTAIDNARESYEKYDKLDVRQKIISDIRRDDEVDGFIRGIVKGVKEGDWYANMIDSTKPIRDLTDELLKKEPNLKGKDNPIQQVLSLLGVDGKAKQWLENHPVLRNEQTGKLEIQKDAKPLLGVYQKLLKDGTLATHEGYMIALHNIELYKNGKGAAATRSLEESQKAKELFEQDLGEDYAEQFAKDLDTYQKLLLRYYFESGKLSKEVYETILKDYNYYIPYKRFFEEYEMTGQLPNVSKYLKDTSPSPVKKIKGSDRDILSPFGSIIKNTYDLIAAADRNTALQTLVDAMIKVDKTLADAVPGRTFKRVRVIAKPEIKIDPETGQPYLAKPENFTEIRTAVEYTKPKRTPIITVYKDGKANYYEIPKDIYDSFFSVSEPVSKAIRWLAGPSRLLQAGAVIYDPTFSIRNIIRDQISALFYSKYGYRPFIDAFLGFKSAVKKDEIYQKFLASGADQSFLTAMDQMMTKGYMEQRTGARIQTTWQRYRRNPVEILRDLNRATEIGSRVGAFRNAYLKTGDVYKAMQEGREITADYGVRGQMMRNIGPLYPFLNARLQHARRTAESLKENPARVAGLGLPIMAESILVWLANNSSDERKELYYGLPEWRRYGMWNIPIPGTDSFLPLPKGFFGMLFGSSVESALDYMINNNPEALKALAGEMYEEIAPLPSPTKNLPAYLPQFIRPAAELWANKVGFTDRPIVSDRLKGLEPYDQYTDFTSTFAKFLSKRLNDIGIEVAPLKLDAFIAGYTAGAGRGVLRISDEILELAGITEPSGLDTFTRLSRLPLTKAIFTETPRGTRSQYVEDFYQRLDEMETLNKTVNNYITDGKTTELDEFLKDEDRSKDYKFYLNNQKQINKFRDVLRAVRDLKSDIYKNPDVKDKQETINAIENEITDMAIAFRESYNNNSEFNINEYLNDILRESKSEKKTIRREQKRYKRDFTREEEE